MQRLENPETRPDGGPITAARPIDVRWKRALKGVVGAAFRLHHYRFVRTQMLHEALSAARDDIEGRAAAPASRQETPR
jgi:hypothetical protein